jgi:hypothetical protein
MLLDTQFPVCASTQFYEYPQHARGRRIGSFDHVG